MDTVFFLNAISNLYFDEWLNYPFVLTYDLETAVMNQRCRFCNICRLSYRRCIACYDALINLSKSTRRYHCVWFVTHRCTKSLVSVHRALAIDCATCNYPDSLPFKIPLSELKTLIQRFFFFSNWIFSVNAVFSFLGLFMRASRSWVMIYNGGASFTSRKSSRNTPAEVSASKPLLLTHCQ